MRPTKLTQPLLEAFQAVLADELSAIAFTEEELVWLANQRLPEHERITYRTFQRYKAEVLNETQDARHKTQDETCKSLSLQIEEDAENAKLFMLMHDTLKGALLTQKKALVRGVMEGQANWRRYTWMLERKFPDFRLKSLTEALAKPTVPIGEKNESQKQERTLEEQKRRKQLWGEKVAAEKAAEAERLKDPTYKWSKGYSPFKPASENGYYTMYPEKLKELEEEMARDVAAGYEDPFAHLGYRPDPDAKTDGHFLVMGMGLHRLPLLAHVYRTADAPDRERREELWLEQEQKRRNIIRAEQGLPPENLPEPHEHAPSEPNARGRNMIYGHSGMGRGVI